MRMADDPQEAVLRNWAGREVSLTDPGKLSMHDDMRGDIFCEPGIEPRRNRAYSELL